MKTKGVFLLSLLLTSLFLKAQQITINEPIIQEHTKCGLGMFVPGYPFTITFEVQKDSDTVIPIQYGVVLRKKKGFTKVITINPPGFYSKISYGKERLIELFPQWQQMTNLERFRMLDGKVKSVTQ
jgi:hypothetical protein